MFLAAALLLACSAASAETIVVGGAAATLADAVRLAGDGDTIVLPSGEYRGDVAVVLQRRLTIRGTGPTRPVLAAAGRHAEGKAIIVVRDGDVLIENIEFRGARVPDGNGAGIRFERGRLQVRHCAFHDNEMGLLTANFGDAELVIEDSLFAHAPRHEGSLHHLLYVGRIASLKVSGSRFEQGFIGHLLKSRARRTELVYNLLVDGALGSASYEVDLPNGGDALLVGNVIGQSANSRNTAVVAFGAEGNAWVHSRLRMAHNTLLSDGARPASFLRVWHDRLPPGTPVQLLNNLSIGNGSFEAGPHAEAKGHAEAAASMLVDVDALDFRLQAGSALRGRAIDPRDASDGELTPRLEFSLPLGTRPLPPPARWSPGALQR